MGIRNSYSSKEIIIYFNDKIYLAGVNIFLILNEFISFKYGDIKNRLILKLCIPCIEITNSLSLSYI